MQKIAYLDIDGTLRSRDKQISGGIQFEYDDRSDIKIELRELFGVSYISKQTISNLNKLKQLGVSLVGVTARDKMTALYINPDVLKLFDRIYWGSSFCCYDVKKRSVCEEYSKDVTSIYKKEIESKLIVLRNILEQFNLPPTIYPTQELEAYMYIHLTGFNVNIDALRECCKLHGIYTILFNTNGYNLLEVKLAPSVSKAVAVAKDRERYDASYAVCIGDSLTDYEMLSVCDLGIFPTSLVDKVHTHKSFTSIGLEVSKIVTTDDKLFIQNNLKEAIAAFVKVNKNLSTK